MFLLHGQAQRMSVILSFRRSLGTASKDPVDDAALASDESRLAKAMYTCLIQLLPGSECERTRVAGCQRF